MKPFRLHSIAFLFTPVMAICALAPAVMAEQPAVSPQAPAESKKTPPPARAKPQVIYHLPRTSTYAATLHSQAKGQTNALPIDSSMPISLQMSRAAANAAAAQAEQEVSPPPSNPTESANSAEISRQRTIKRAKIQSKRSQVRRRAFPKGSEPQSSPGDKSQKK